MPSLPRLALLVVLALIAVATATAPLTTHAARPPDSETLWRQATVDAAGLLGRQVAARHDGRGRAHVAYVDASRLPWRVMHAWREALAWQVEPVGEVVGFPVNGRRVLDLFVDRDGGVHLAWLDIGTASSATSDDQLVYARRQPDGSYTIETVASIDVGAPALAVTGDGSVRIAYETLSMVRVATRGTAGWAIGHLADGTGTGLVAAGVDDLGRVRIAFVGPGSPPRPRLATRETNGQWTAFDLDAAPPAQSIVQSLAFAQPTSGSRFVASWVTTPAVSGAGELRLLHAIGSGAADLALRVLETAPAADAMTVLGATLSRDGTSQVLRFRYVEQSRLTTNDAWRVSPAGVVTREAVTIPNADVTTLSLSVAPDDNDGGSAFGAETSYADIVEYRRGMRWRLFRPFGLPGYAAPDRGMAMTRDDAGEPEFVASRNNTLWRTRYVNGSPVSEDLGPTAARTLELDYAAGPGGRRTIVRAEGNPGDQFVSVVLRDGAEGTPWQYVSLGRGSAAHAFDMLDGTRVVVFNADTGRLRAWIRAVDGAVSVVDHPGGADGAGGGRSLDAVARQLPRDDGTPGPPFVHASYIANTASIRVATLARFDGTWAFSDQIAVPNTGDPIDGRAAIAVDGVGGLHLVFARRIGGGSFLQFARSDGAGWALEALAPAPLPGTPVALLFALRDGVPSARRVAVIARDAAGAERLLLESTYPGVAVPAREDFDLLPSSAVAPTSTRLALESAGDDRLAWIDFGDTDGFGGLRLAHTRDLGPPQAPALDPGAQGGNLGSTPSPPGGPAADLIRILACQCHKEPCSRDPMTGVITGCEAGSCLFNSGGALRAIGGTQPVAATDDPGPGLRALFSTTPAGRYYLDLWRLNGPEIVRLTLANPVMLRDRFRTYADFAPGLRALVNGNGNDYRMNRSMIINARNVWQQWADRGSPELRATVQQELARTNNLDRFTDMSFQGWFDSLTVGPEQPLMRDGFE